MARWSSAQFSTNFEKSWLKAVWITASDWAAPLLQAVQIRERAAMDLGARRGQRLRSLVRAGEAEHLMAGGDQVLDDGRADPAGGSSDKYAHEQNLQVSLETQCRACGAILVK